MLNAIMLNFVMQSVILLNVLAPKIKPLKGSIKFWRKKWRKEECCQNCYFYKPLKAFGEMSSFRSLSHWMLWNCCMKFIYIFSGALCIFWVIKLKKNMIFHCNVCVVSLAAQKIILKTTFTLICSYLLYSILMEYKIF